MYYANILIGHFFYFRQFIINIIRKFPFCSIAACVKYKSVQMTVINDIKPLSGCSNAAKTADCGAGVLGINCCSSAASSEIFNDQATPSSSNSNSTAKVNLLNDIYDSKFSRCKKVDIEFENIKYTVSKYSIAETKYGECTLFIIKLNNFNIINSVLKRLLFISLLHSMKGEQYYVPKMSVICIYSYTTCITSFFTSFFLVFIFLVLLNSELPILTLK